MPGPLSDALVAARALIADPACWTTNTMARNKTGRPCEHDDPNAVCFCAAGALAKICPDGPLYAEALTVLGNAAARQHNRWPVTSVNDRKGHDAILKVFDEAIETCSSSSSPKLAT